MPPPVGRIGRLLLGSRRDSPSTDALLPVRASSLQDNQTLPSNLPAYALHALPPALIRHLSFPPKEQYAPAPIRQLALQLVPYRNRSTRPGLGWRQLYSGRWVCISYCCLLEWQQF